jgi:hypothetical protein
MSINIVLVLVYHRHKLLDLISCYLRNFGRGYVGLTLLSWVVLQKPPPVAQLFRNFPAFYCTQRFITMFTRAHCWSLLRARLTQSIPPHHISLRSILKIDCHQFPGPPSGLFSSAFPPKPCMQPYFPYEYYMTCQSHPQFDHSNYDRLCQTQPLNITALLCVKFTNPLCCVLVMAFERK